MTPKVGEVYMLDLDYQGKVRPVVIMSRDDPDAPALWRCSYCLPRNPAPAVMK